MELFGASIPNDSILNLAAYLSHHSSVMTVTRPKLFIHCMLHLSCTFLSTLAAVSNLIFLLHSDAKTVPYYLIGVITSVTRFSLLVIV